MTFIDKDGEKYDFQVSEGDNLLDIAQANDLEMEGLNPLLRTRLSHAYSLRINRCMWRFVRLLNMSCYCGGPGYV